MARLFLSGQTTCALLLGAGLLLRAQAALRQEPVETAQRAPIEAPRTVHAEPFPEQTVRAKAPRVARTGTDAVTPRRGNARSHSKKGLAHRQARVAKRACGVRVASKGFRCG